MNERIKQMAEELKNELLKSNEVNNYFTARDAYNSDTAVVKKVEEYNIHRSVYETEQGKEEPDTLLLTSLGDNMERLYHEIINSQTAQDLSNAENDLNGIYSGIMNILQSIVVPEHDHSCGGSCGGCHGCG